MSQAPPANLLEYFVVGSPDKILYVYCNSVSYIELDKVSRSMLRDELFNRRILTTGDIKAEFIGRLIEDNARIISIERDYFEQKLKDNKADQENQSDSLVFRIKSEIPKKRRRI